jgi:prepilin-type N-terminal cleavage/methylation domain-containing protein
MKVRAFTLVELLIVISIIGILIGIGTYGYSASMMRSRDTTRKADLHRLENVLGQYNNDKRTYVYFHNSIPKLAVAAFQLNNDPFCLKGNIPDTYQVRLQPNYIRSIPSDPKYPIPFTANNSVNCESDKIYHNSGQYLYLSGPTDDVANTPVYPAIYYGLMATLENKKDKDIIAEKYNPIMNTSNVFGKFYSDLRSGQNYILTNASIATLLSDPIPKDDSTGPGDAPGGGIPAP